ncbi:MAG: DUF4129 domain-containing protein, partial [Anaerolineae bacterium]
LLLIKPAQAASPLSLDEYWRKLQETHTVVQSLETAAPETQQARLSTLADQWQQITAVRLPDGTELPVDHTFLLAHLRTIPPDLPGLRKLLDQLLAARQNWPEASHTAQDVELFKSILARAEFQWQPEQPSPLTQWLIQARQWLWNWLRHFLPQQAVISVDGSLLGYGLTGLGILALLALLALTLRGLWSDFVSQAELDPEMAADGQPLTADAAFKRAQDLSGAGDYRTAVRYLYLSSLLLLEERGVLRYDRSKTNREYLRSVANSPGLATTLREVIDVFDRVWYGYQPLDEASYARYAAQVTQLRQQK